MRNISVILLAVYLMFAGAYWANWISMQAHTFGVVTFVIGLAILVIEFFSWGNGNGWFANRRTP
jgi:hypothetical protein